MSLRTLPEPPTKSVNPVSFALLHNFVSQVNAIHLHIDLGFPDSLLWIYVSVQNGND